jgi:hypothetical protein
MPPESLAVRNPVEYQSFGWMTRAFGLRRPVTRTAMASTMASMSVPAEPTGLRCRVEDAGEVLTGTRAVEDLVLQLLVEAVAQEVVDQGADLRRVGAARLVIGIQWAIVLTVVDTTSSAMTDSGL